MFASKKIFPTVVYCVFFTQTLTACKPSPKADTATVQTTQPNGQNLSPNLTAHTSANPQPAGTADNTCNNQAIYRAFSQKNQNQKTQVLGCGQVKKLLKDDNDGSRHQKFLISIDGYPQMTVLVAHNIDLATRVNAIEPNTPIRFYGEYIYNDKGGVLHWTHKDPTARHQDGWLEYHGQKYW